MKFLELCPNLEHLDLSYNAIKNIKDLGNCKKLTNLYLHFNLLTELDDLCDLEQCYDLKELKIRGNPVSEEKEYLSFIMAVAPKL